MRNDSLHPTPALLHPAAHSETTEARGPRGRHLHADSSGQRGWKGGGAALREGGSGGGCRGRGERRRQDGQEERLPGVGRLLYVRRLSQRDEVERPLHTGRGLVSRYIRGIITAVSGGVGSRCQSVCDQP